MGDCSVMGLYAQCGLYLLGILLCCSIYLFFRHTRLRQTLLGAESVSTSTFSDTDVEKAHLDILPSFLDPYPPTQDILFANPLLDASHNPPPFTSGYLAARADKENAAKVGSHTGNRINDRISDTMTACHDAKRLLSSNRGVDLSISTEPLQSEQAERAFRDDAHYDHTEHLQDEHDPAIFWRRRTMVFGCKP